MHFSPKTGNFSDIFDELQHFNNFPPNKPLGAQVA